VSTHSSNTCASEAAPDALRRELDRRQRVLDLVRDAARDLAPRRHALRADLLRVVVEHDHRAERAALVVLEQRQRDDERQHFLAARHHHLLAHALAHAGPRLRGELA
jgi:hypothetical protein